MSVDLESLSEVLKHPMRREILSALDGRKTISYVDLMSLVGATNTGKFNYHLKILGDLIEKDQNGKYVLTEKGQTATELFHKFPEKKAQRTILGMGDAALVGFAGVVLTVVNPVFWVTFLAAITKPELTVPFFYVLGFLGFGYALIVPGAVMYLLTVRRAHSHDMYDLLKPPLVTFILLLVLLIAMILLNISVTVTITSPEIPVPGPYAGFTYSVMQTSLHMFLLLGLIFSFLGVIIAEFAGKARKRIMS